MSDGTGIGRRECPACETEQPSIAMTCRECGEPLLVGESAGRSWLRWGAVGLVVVLGAVGTFLAITSLWEPYVEPETDIAWSLALGSVREGQTAGPESWTATPAGDVIVLSRPGAARGIARDTGRIVWRANLEVTGDVQMAVAPTVGDGVVVMSAGSSIHVIDPATGEVRWTATEDGTVAGHAAVAGGLVAVSRGTTMSGLGSHIALHDVATGEERGRIPTLDLLEVGADARVDVDHVEGIAADEDRLYVSMRHWEHEEGDAPDDTTTRVFGHLIGMDLSDGGRIWNLVGEGAVRAPQVTSHGLVSVRWATAEGTGAVLGIDPTDGSETWRWEPAEGRWFLTADLVTGDRVALFEGDDETHELVLIDVATGEEAWRADVPPLGPPIVAASDRGVYVTGHPGEEDGAPVWAFDPATGEELWEVRVDLGGEGPRGGDGLQGLEADDRGPYLLDDRGGLRGLDPADGTTLWQTAASGEVAATAPTVHDGWVYVIGWDGLMRAVDIAAGEERWSARIGTRGFSQPAVDALGAYAVTGLGSIRAIDLETGDERWRTENRLESLVDAAATPTVMDGLVVAAVGEEVIAIEAESGDERWVVDLPATGLQVAAGGGLVAAVDEGGALHAIDPASGEVRWSEDLGGGVVAVSVVDDERFIALTVDGELHLVDATDGGSRWVERFDDPVPAAPTVTEELVYVVDGGHVRALDLGSGELRWSHDAGEALAGAVDVDGDRVHVGTAGTVVIVLDGASGEEVARLDLGEPLGSDPAAVDGLVLVRAGGHLVALE